MKKVFVIGSGTMGSGIVQACAQSGCAVVMADIDRGMLEKGLKAIQWSLAKMEEKGKLKEPKEALLSRIVLTDGLDQANETDLVIEAISEDLAAKQDLLRKLEDICSEITLMGTNTSSIPITEIAAALKFPERVVGIHFFNPVHRMKLVEIIRGLSTSDKRFCRQRNSYCLSAKSR